MAQELREKQTNQRKSDRPQQYSQSGNSTSKNVRMVKEKVAKLREAQEARGSDKLSTH